MAAEIDVELAAHWNASAGYYVATLDSEAGPDHQKPSELDSAIVLAALAAGQSEGTLSPLSDRLLSTASALEHAFAKVYAINADPSTGTAIGRYTEDHYFGGNPWFLTTAAFAELHYRVAEVLQQRTSYYMTAQAQEFFASALPLAYRPMLRPGQDILADRSLASVIIQSLIAKGDRFLDRIRRHGGQDGSLSEQFDRNTGMMLSARDLTWSYASFIQAAAQRDRTTTAFATRR
jgi:glucoamylase